MSMSQRSIAAYTTRRPYDSTPFRSHARSKPCDGADETFSRSFESCPMKPTVRHFLASVGGLQPYTGIPAKPRSEASSSRFRARSQSGALPRARSSRPGRPDGPCDTTPRCESSRLPRDRKWPSDWQRIAPTRWDRLATTLGLFFCRRMHLSLAMAGTLLLAFSSLSVQVMGPSWRRKRP